MGCAKLSGLDATTLSALRTYSAAITHYNRLNEAYFAVFADELECFYGRHDVSGDSIRKRRSLDKEIPRLHVVDVGVVTSSADLVVLLDQGLIGEDAAYSKLVEFVQVWRV